MRTVQELQEAQAKLEARVERLEAGEGTDLDVLVALQELVDLGAELLAARAAAQEPVR